MDSTTAQLVDYAMGIGYGDPSPAVVDACRIRLIDTLGCASGRAILAGLASFEQCPDVTEVVRLFDRTPGRR